MQTKPTSAYVHIPFCTQICYYCDFSKVFIKNQPVDDYLRALIREWELLDIKASHPFILVVGPDSYFCRAIGLPFAKSSEKLGCQKLEEFTIEANPGDLTVDKIEVLKKSAVNRVSLGVQTFDDKHLRQNGRSTIKHRFMKALISLKGCWFS